MMIIFFDIEVVSEFSKEERESQDFLSLKEKYEDKLNFMPEYNKILCIVAGYQLESGTIKTKIYKNGETEFLGEKEFIEEFFDNFKNHQLCGYNIKGFDIPFIIKRAIKHGIEIPNSLKAYGKKPREFENIIDLFEVWKHVGKNACNIDVLTKFLGFVSPKDFGIDGSQVQEFFDFGKEDEIIKYCERDVKATIEIYKKFKELNLI